jgi:hypothetical protein
METKGLRAKRFPYPAPWGGTFLIKTVVERFQLKIIIYDPIQEVILQWKN